MINPTIFILPRLIINQIKCKIKIKWNYGRILQVRKTLYMDILRNNAIAFFCCKKRYITATPERNSNKSRIIGQCCNMNNSSRT